MDMNHRPKQPSQQKPGITLQDKEKITHPLPCQGDPEIIRLPLPPQAQRARAQGAEWFQRLKPPFWFRGARMPLPRRSRAPTESCSMGRATTQSHGVGSIPLSHGSDAAIPVGLEDKGQGRLFSSLMSKEICPIRFCAYLETVTVSSFLVLIFGMVMSTLYLSH